jgi:hypothetical protein
MFFARSASFLVNVELAQRLDRHRGEGDRVHHVRVERTVVERVLGRSRPW